MSSRQRRSVAYAQNFLRDPRLVDRLLDRAGIEAGDLVVEIGPGRGAITARLAPRCRQVLAVELDPSLGERLRRRFAGAGNVAVFAADFLGFPLPVTPFKVVGNIPFNATAAIVGKLTSGSSPPDEAFLIVQHEAAGRFLGEPRETLPALLLKPWFAPSLLHRFRPADFDPVPRVEPVLLRLSRRMPPLVEGLDAPLYRDLVAHAFTAWRPTVREAMATILSRPALVRVERMAGIDLRRPPASVPFADWLALFAAFRSLGDERALRALRGAEDRLSRQQAGLQKIHRTRTPSRGPGRATPLLRPGRIG